MTACPHRPARACPAIAALSLLLATGVLALGAGPARGQGPDATGPSDATATALRAPDADAAETGPVPSASAPPVADAGPTTPASDLAPAHDLADATGATAAPLADAGPTTPAPDTVLHFVYGVAPDPTDTDADATAAALADADAPAQADAGPGPTAPALTDADAGPAEATVADPDDAGDAGDADDGADAGDGGDAADGEGGDWTQGATSPEPGPPGLSPSDGAIATILSLLVLLALAYVGGHPRVHALESRLGIAQVVTAGFPFVALGLLAAQPSIAVLNPTVLHRLVPVLELGLGWIGFAVGFRFDARLLDGLPRTAAITVALSTLIPLFAIAAASSLLLLASGQSLTEGTFVRDALILGIAGAMAAHTVPRLMQARGAAPASIARVARLVQLEELTGMIGLIFLGAFFRPSAVGDTWQIPGVAWLYVTLGMGAIIGVLLYVVLRRFNTTAEFLVVQLGSVAFAAGMASYLHFSPIAVCFIAGVVLVNLPGDYKALARDALGRLERPVYLIFLVVAGALWDVGQWQGWVLLVLFVGARFFGKWLGLALVRRRDPHALRPVELESLAFAPVGALSIAIVVNARYLYPDATISWLVTAVIGGALVTEIILQLGSRRARRSLTSASPTPEARS